MHLLNTQRMNKFWKHYSDTVALLTSCTNNYYVNKTDREDLLVEKSPLERNHLRYLLMKDKDILDI